MATEDRLPIPLLPGTKLYFPPQGMSEDDVKKAPLGRQMELALLAEDPATHFLRAGFNPWDADCPHCEPKYGKGAECLNDLPACRRCKGSKKIRHGKQIEFLDMDVDDGISLFVGGIGSGKTVGGAAKAVKESVSQPFCIGIVAAPTYKQLASSTVPMLLPPFGLLHKDAIASWNKSEGEVRLTNGSIIWLRSTEDPEPIRGINAAWFWYDEGAMGNENGFDILVGRIRAPKFRNLGWMTTTPKGRNWVFKVFVQQRKGKGMVQCSARDNPFLKPSYISRLESKYAGAFAEQEIEGGFAAYEGLVYRNFRHDRHIVKDEDLPKTFRRIWYGHDWGGKDPFVVLAVGEDEDRRLWVLDELYKSYVTIDAVVAKRQQFRDTYERANPGAMGVADKSGWAHIEYLNQKGYTTESAAGGEKALINYGLALLYQRLESDEKDEQRRPRLFIHERCVDTIREFQLYRYDDPKGNQPAKDKPRDEDNHAMDSLRYVVVKVDSGEGWSGESVTLDDTLFERAGDESDFREGLKWKQPNMI